MTEIYLAKVEWFCEHDGDEKTNYCLIPAESYVDATKQVINDWGEDSVIGIELHVVSDEDGCILVSDTMAEAFLHDIPEDVYCIASDYKMKHNKEN